jgi:Asp-tRNA(Asn)/Glu-tRNA(Gln) amidotransferase B subunit
MDSTEEELLQLQNSIKLDNTVKYPQQSTGTANTVMSELKQTLEQLKTANPAFLDSNKVFTNILSLVDEAVVTAADAKMAVLADCMMQMQNSNQKIADALLEQGKRFSLLETKIKNDNDYTVKFKERATGALQAIESYLRTHG